MSASASEPRPLIDESAARWAAHLTTPTRPTRRDEVERLRAAVRDDLPRVDAAARTWTRLGDQLPPTSVRVVGRVGWVEANLVALRGAFDPLAQKVRANPATAARVLGAQIGALLGLLSAKVLGQFVLPFGGPTGGQLVVVGPNLLALADKHGDLADGIRRAVLLHEVTHRLQFDAVDWLGDHLRGLLGRYLEHARIDTSAMLEAMSRLPEAVARARRTGTTQPIIEAVLTPEQAELVGEAQGLMSLLEGHGNAAMFDAADGLLDDPEGVRAVLQERRTDVTSRVLSAVAGLEMKRRQYREGEAFVRAVVDAAGVEGLNHAFAAPGNLPTPDEVRVPESWLTRVVPAAG